MPLPCLLQLEKCHCLSLIRVLLVRLPAVCGMACFVLVVQELQRILADKELKDALLSGIQAFNQNAVKGASYADCAGLHRAMLLA